MFSFDTADPVSRNNPVILVGSLALGSIASYNHRLTPHPKPIDLSSTSQEINIRAISYKCTARVSHARCVYVCVHLCASTLCVYTRIRVNTRSMCNQRAFATRRCMRSIPDQQRSRWFIHRCSPIYYRASNQMYFSLFAYVCVGIKLRAHIILANFRANASCLELRDLLRWFHYEPLCSWKVLSEIFGFVESYCEYDR